jgi:hypothetical protein
MQTAIVILNWNTKDLLSKFLPPLLSSTAGRDATVIVADSASKDGSMEMMAEAFPGVRRIVLDRNYGFAEGYDKALEGLDAEYYVLINSDVEVTEGWLDPLVDWMESHPDCGACGPKLKSWYDRDSFEYAGAAGGFIDKYGFPFCRGRVMNLIEKDEGQYDTPMEVMWVSGACMMVRRSAWEELGGLDRRFFAHMEEIDLCWRMQLAGYSIASVPQSVVYHMGGGTLPTSSPWKLELNYRNNLLMLENCLPGTVGICKARILLALRMVLDGISAVIYLFQRKPEYFSAVWNAHQGFRKLRLGMKRSSMMPVKGRYEGWIVPKALFMKPDKLFCILRDSLYL